MNAIVAAARRLGSGALLFLFALLVSCGGEGATGGANAANKVGVRLVGAVPAEFSEEVDQLFSNDASGARMPVVIGEVDLETLPQSQRAAVVDAFTYDVPVVLIKPTLERLQALRSLLGIEGSDSPTDLPELWAVQTNRSYEVWEYYFDAPASRQLVRSDAVTFENGSLITSYGTETVADLVDGDVYQYSRIASLRDWLEVAPQRALVGEQADETPEAGGTQEPGVAKVPAGAGAAVASGAGKSAAAGSAGEPADLMAVAQADYARANFSYLGNRYAITVKTRSVYQAPYTYFVVEPKGILSAVEEWLNTTNQQEREAWDAHNRGTVAHSYDVSFSVPETSVFEVTEVTDTLPRTVENVTEVSDTFGWDLGGKATLAGECTAGDKTGCSAKVGVDVSGGVKASVSTKTNVRDVVVANKTSFGHPAWRFTIPPPEPNNKYIFTFLGADIYWTFPKVMARATFQPEMGWVWRVSDSVRGRYPNGLPLVIEFLPTLIHCYSHGNAILPYYIGERETLKPAAALSYQVTVPWPPTAAR